MIRFRKIRFRLAAWLLCLCCLGTAGFAEAPQAVVELPVDSASALPPEEAPASPTPEEAPAPLLLEEQPLDNAAEFITVQRAALSRADGGVLSDPVAADARLLLDYTLSLPDPLSEGMMEVFPLPDMLVYDHSEATRDGDGNYVLAPRTEYSLMQNGSVVGTCTVDPAAKTAAVTLTADAVPGQAALRLTAGLDTAQEEPTRTTAVEFPAPTGTAPVSLTVTPAYFTFLSDAHLYDAAKFKPSDPAGSLVPFDKDVPRDAAVLLAYSYLVPQRGADAGVFPVQPGIRYHFALPPKTTLPEGNTQLDFAVTQGANTVGTVHVSADPASPCASYLEFQAVAPGGEDHFDPQNYGTADAPNPGVFLFTGRFDADAVGTGGKQSIPFEVNGVQVAPSEDLYFSAYDPKAKVELTKGGTADLAQLRLDWTLTVKATVEFGESVTNLVITDTIGQAPDQTYDPAQSVTVTDADGSPVQAAAAYDGAAKTLTITFPDAVPDGSVYTVHYYTNFALSAFTANKLTFTNTAQASYERPHYSLGDDGALKLETPIAQQTDPVKKQVQVAGDFVKKVTGPWNAKSVSWTVTLNEHGFLLAAPTFEDELPAGLKLDDGSLKLSVNDGTPVVLQKAADAADPKDYEYTYTDGNDTQSSILVVKLPADLTDKLVLTYVTTATESFWQDNETHVLKNVAKVNIGNGPITGEATATIQAAHLLGKSASYDPRTHALTYHIQANTSEHYELTNVTITDTLPAGLTLALADKSGPSGLTVYGELTEEEIDRLFTFDTAVRPSEIAYQKRSDGNETLTFTFADAIQPAQSFGVRFSALVDDATLWAVNLTNWNLKNTFNADAGRNTAEMTATLGGASHVYKVAAGAPLTSTVIAKAGLPNEYDAAAHSPKWRITVNQNQMKLTAPVVVDTLPGGQTYDAAQAQLTVYQYGVGQSGAASARSTDPTGNNFGVTAVPSADGKSVTFSFPGEIDQQYALEFYTQAGEDVLAALLNQSAGDAVTVENQAALQPGKEVPDAQTVQAKQNIGQGMVRKTAEVTRGQSYLDWRVTVNQNLMQLEEFRLEDTLPQGLRLDVSHVAFYKLENLGVTGAVTSATTRTALPLPAGTVTTDADGKTLVFQWDEPIDTAYELVFRPDLTAASGKFDGENKISLGGVSSVLEDGSGTVHQAVAGGGGVWSPPQYAACTLKKVDALTGEPLPGAVFQLQGGGVYADTDGDGCVTLTNLKVGTSYTVTEVTAPDGYLLDAAPRTIKPSKAGDFTVEVPNGRRAGSLVLQKQDTEGTALDGARFAFYEKDAQGAQANVRTLELTNGKVTVPGLVPGTYYFRETAAPAGYALDETEYTLTVAADAAAPDVAPGVTMAVTDGAGTAVPLSAAGTEFSYAVADKILGTLTMTKTEAGDPARLLAGAVLALYEQAPDGTYSQVGTAQTTGADGTAVFTDLVEGVQYYAHELTPPAGYRLDDAYTPLVDVVTLATPQLAHTVENQPRLGAVTIQKQDAENGALLAGAVFEAYAAGQEPGTDTPLGTLTTGADGQALLDGLRTGDYFLVETAAPAGYLPDGTRHPFTLEDDGETGTRVSADGAVLTAPLMIANRPCTGGVVLTKQNTAGTPLAGARFCVYEKDGQGTVNMAARRWAVTGADGTATVTGLRPGTYYYAEDTAPAGYLVDPAEHTFTIALDDTQATGAAAVREAPVVDLRRGTLAVQKQDADTKKPLAGAVFSVLRAGAEKPLFTGATDADGNLTVPDTVVLQEGVSYTVREDTPPQGYQADAAPQTFTVTPEQADIRLVFVNKATPKPVEPDEPDQPDQPDQPEEPSTPDDGTAPAPPAPEGGGQTPSAPATAPRTGDHALTVSLALLAAGALGLTALGVTARKKR